MFLWFDSQAKRAGSSFLASRDKDGLWARLFNELSQSVNEPSWLDTYTSPYYQRCARFFLQEGWFAQVTDPAMSKWNFCRLGFAQLHFFFVC